jgi:FkbM family methyltransferase
MNEKTLLAVKHTLGTLGLLKISEFVVRSVTATGREFRAHRNRMLGFYRQFVRPGDLCFDIGANLGSRVDVFLHLGATVIAVEPQLHCVDYLRMRYGRNRRVIVVGEGLDEAEGEQTLHMNSNDSPTASMSPTRIAAIAQSRKFSDYAWDRAEVVRVTTLDKLIAIHGRPLFCKIDVEGFEYQVLKGLTQPIQALSYEYTTDFIQPALDCVTYLSRLDNYMFNLSHLESMQLVLSDWVDANRMYQILDSMPQNHPSSGDVYARRL